MMTHYVILESVCRNSIVVNSMTKLASSHLLSQIISKTFLMPDRGFLRKSQDLIYPTLDSSNNYGNIILSESFLD